MFFIKPNHTNIIIRMIALPYYFLALSDVISNFERKVISNLRHIIIAEMFRMLF